MLSVLRSPNPTLQETDVPAGLNIPGLVTLLNGQVMCAVINSAMPGGGRVFASCEIVNLRIKTPNACLVSYRLEPTAAPGAMVHAYARAFDAPSFHEAAAKLGDTRWVDSESGVSTLVLGDQRAILYFYPNDERLHGLRRLSVAKKLQRLFYVHLPEYPPDAWRVSDRSIRHQLLRYKPERRAVLRCRFRAHRNSDDHREERFIFISVFEEGRDADVWKTATGLHELTGSADWTVPTPLAHIPEHSAVLMDSLDGDSLKSVVEGAGKAGDLEPHLSRVARALAGMHHLQPRWLPVITPASRLSVIKEIVDRISWLTPELSLQAQECQVRLAAHLRECPVYEPSFVHGDLHPGQILLGPQRCGFVDFDRAHLGDPTLDLAMFLAQLVQASRLRHASAMTEVADRWLEEYRSASSRSVPDSNLETWKAYSLLQSSLRPLGRFEPGWRARIRRALDGVLDCLQ